MSRDGKEVAFGWSIGYSRFYRRDIAFINWTSEEGQSCCVGTLTFSDPTDLRDAAAAVALALNATIRDYWDDSGA